MNTQKEIEPAVSELKTRFVKLKSSGNEIFHSIVDARDGVISRFRPVFSSENVFEITEQEFKEFLLFDNNKHWSGYFIHRLINQRDLQTIGNEVSYTDKITEESIPTLPIGTCVFSGIATPMPLKLKIEELPDEQKADSHTLQFEKISEVTQ